MALNAAYELPYTGEQVEELLGKVTTNETAIEQLEESVDGIQTLTNMEIEALLT